MVNTNRLRGIIAECGLSQRKVAAELGITEKTFYTKTKSGIFDSAEMSAMISLLNIENPAEIFLPN